MGRGEGRQPWQEQRQGGGAGEAGAKTNSITTQRSDRAAQPSCSKMQPGGPSALAATTKAAKPLKCNEQVHCQLERNDADKQRGQNCIRENDNKEQDAKHDALLGPTPKAPEGTTAPKKKKDE